MKKIVVIILMASCSAQHHYPVTKDAGKSYKEQQVRLRAQFK